MRLRSAAFLLVTGFICGCASDPFRTVSQPGLPAAVELDEVPFFPQEAYQCGPAALATILVESGVAIAPDQLIPKVYLPGRRGSLQPELLAASRQYERIPYVIPPDFEGLVAEVAAGRPVLVLQNLGVSLAPVWHYAVVVGFSRERKEVILRSGTDARRVMRSGVFANTWRRGGNWGVVSLLPGELPEDGDGTRYLRAVAAAESAGNLELARASYAAAAERWPGNLLAWLGLGNTAYARGEPEVAERMYRRALEVDAGNAVTLNNLASTVAELGRCSEAEQYLQAALALPEVDDMMGDVLAESLAEVDACR